MSFYERGYYQIDGQRSDMRVDSEIPKPRPMMGKFQSYKQLFRNQVRDGMKGAPTQG